MFLLQELTACWRCPRPCAGTWCHGDEGQAKKLLRRAYELGVTHFDTADACGPESAEHYLRKTLRRYADEYPEGIVIATEGGYTRQGPDLWAPCGRPEYLMQCIAMSQPHRAARPATT